MNPEIPVLLACVAVLVGAFVVMARSHCQHRINRRTLRCDECDRPLSDLLVDKRFVENPAERQRYRELVASGMSPGLAEIVAARTAPAVRINSSW